MHVVSKKFSIAQPHKSHSRPAKCEEVDCKNNKFGWKVRVEGLPADLYKYVTSSGRKFSRIQEGPGMTFLVFREGQQCFDGHRVSLDRPQLFFVKDEFGQTRKHTQPEFWVEEHSEALDKLRKKIEG